MKKWFCTAAAVLSLFLIVTSVTAAALPGQEQPEEGRETIRVGFTLEQGYAEQNEEGISGYFYEYLWEIAKFTGWKYEMVVKQPRQGEELAAMLQSGEIDLLCGVRPGTKLSEVCLMPDFNCGFYHTTLAVMQDNPSFLGEGPAVLDGMRVGVLEGDSQRLLDLQDYCRDNEIQVTPVLFDSEEQQYTQLSVGAVDAVLGGDKLAWPGARIFASFAARPFSIGVSQERGALLKQLNTAMGKIKDVSYDFDTQLHKQYFPQSVSMEFTLSKEEQELVEKLGPLRVASGANNIPLDYFSAEGEHQGITADILKLIAEKTGLEFEPVQAENQEQANWMLKEGKVDLVTGIYEEFYFDQPDFLTPADAYLSIPMVLVKNKGMQAEGVGTARMAMPIGMQLQDHLRDSEAVFYQNTEDCMLAVEKGQVDYCYGNAYSVEYYQRLDLLENITTLSLPDSNRKMAFGLANPVDITLLGIFNKAIRYLTEGDKQKIIFDNTSRVEYHVTLAAYLRANKAEAALGLVCITLFVLLGLLLFAQRKKRTEEQITKRYRILSELSEEAFFEYDFRRDRLEFSSRHADSLFLEPVLTNFYKRQKAGEIHFPLNLVQLAEETVGAGEYGLKGTEDFFWELPNGEGSWFRTVFAVLTGENHRPQSVVGKLWNIDQEKQEKIQLLNMAQKDPLTGLYHKGATELLCNDYLKGDGQGRLHAYVIVDIDDFKGINDTFGHKRGDEILKEAANILKLPFRSLDIIGRIGGDEFCVLVKDLHSKGLIRKKSQDVLREMGKERELDGKKIRLSCSIGVSFYPDDGLTYDELYQKADRALYAVKRQGKQGCLYYSELEREK